MIQMHLHLQDLDKCHTQDRNRITFGESYIEQNEHSACSSKAYVTQYGWLYVVVERFDLSKIDSLLLDAPLIEQEDATKVVTKLLQDNLDIFLDYVIVEFYVDVFYPSVKISVGPAGTAPIYVADKGLEIFCSWDVDFVSRTFGSFRPDIQIISHHLNRNRRYSARTCFSNLTMITANSCFFFDGVRAIHSLPEAAPYQRSEASVNINGIEDFLLERIYSNIKHNNTSLNDCCFEISGGLDSAFIALCMHDYEKTKVCTSGILFSGAQGFAQQQRRRSVINRVSSNDYIVDFDQTLPLFQDGISQDQGVYLWCEPYIDAFMSMWRSAKHKGKSYIVGGCGGDELFPINDTGHLVDCSEKYPTYFSKLAIEACATCINTTSPSLVPETTLLAKAGHSNYLLKLGLWPVYPMADVALTKVCHRLPEYFRENKYAISNLCRNKFGIKNFSGEYHKESFLPQTLQVINANKVHIKQFFNTCVLHEYGVIDVKKLVDHLDINDISEDMASYIIHLLAMEKMCRNFC